MTSELKPLTRYDIDAWKHHFKAQAQSGDITVDLWQELRQLCDLALQSLTPSAEPAKSDLIELPRKQVRITDLGPSNAAYEEGYRDGKAEAAPERKAVQRPPFLHVPCGMSTGHGECCCKDYMCSSCTYILELERALGISTG